MTSEQVKQTPGGPVEITQVHIDLAHKLAGYFYHRIVRRHIDFDELLSAALLGLAKARNNYDESYMSIFEKHASSWMTYEMRELRRNLFKKPMGITGFGEEHCRLGKQVILQNEAASDDVNNDRLFGGDCIEDNIRYVEFQHALEKALIEKVPRRYSSVYTAYLMGERQSDIARKLRVSNSRISQILQIIRACSEELAA